MPGRRRLRLLAVTLPALALLLVAAPAALAQGTRGDLGGKVRSGNEVVVPAGETVPGNLYATGGTVRVEGSVQGDLVASGGTIQVRGHVKGEVLAAGGRIDLTGPVDGDVRLAGGQVTVNGPVGGDLLLAGGQASVNGRVGHDLIFGVGQMTLDGQVAGSVLGSAGRYSRQGTVAGSERVSVSQPKPPPSFADRVLAAVRRLVSILLVAALLLWLLPRVVAGAADLVRGRPLASLGIGLAALVGFGVLVVVAVLVTILLSIVLGLLGLGSLLFAVVLADLALLFAVAAVLYLATTFAAPAAVGLAAGRLALAGQDRGRLWGALVIGVLVIVVLTSIPVVGGIIDFLVAVVGLGSVLLAMAPRRRAGRPQVMRPA